MLGHKEVQGRFPLSAPNLEIFTTFVLPLVGESCDCVSNMGGWEQPAGKYLVSLLRSPQLYNTKESRLRRFTEPGPKAIASLRSN